MVDGLRRGDPSAFEALVIAYQHRVFGVALRMLNTVRSRLHRARTDLKEKLERFLP